MSVMAVQIVCDKKSQGPVQAEVGQDRVKRSRTVAVWRATSRSAREVAHPQLSRSMLEDKPAL